MSSIRIIEHMTLDGVIQGPGGANEDTTDGFTHGGWISGYSDPVLSTYLKEVMNSDFDLLLGRHTYAIWASYWPDHGHIWPKANSAAKFLVSGSSISGTWENTIKINPDTMICTIANIKKENPRDLHVWGSSKLVQALLKHDLVDELSLIVYPVLLGSGKRLFGENPAHLHYELIRSTVTTRGVLIADYRIRHN